MKVLGIDPGSETLGWGIVEGTGVRYNLIEYGTVKSSPKELFSKRLLRIFDGVADVIWKFQPDILSIEEAFYARNVSVALKLGQVRGIVMLAGEKAGIEIVEYAPKLIKQTVVGYGNAEKKQVQEMVRILLRMKAVPQPHDAADALAIAICHFHHAGVNNRIKQAKLKNFNFPLTQSPLINSLEELMKRSYFLLFLILLCSFSLYAQKKRNSSAVKPKAVQRAEISGIAVVVDSRLAILRKQPSLYSDSVQRMRTGRLLSVSAKKDVDGITFYRVTVPPRNYGWVQAEAIIRKNNEEDEQRLFRLIQAAKGFEQFERGAVFLDHFPNPKLRPVILLLLGDLAEETTLKLSRDAARQFDRNEIVASGAPLHSFYLSYSSLDRYRKLGINFWFNSSVKRFHYDGSNWRELTKKYPQSPEAVEAQKRLDQLDKKMESKTEEKLK